jgi:hypothetical protein
MNKIILVFLLLSNGVMQSQTWQRLIDNPFNFGGAEAYGIKVIDDTIYVSSVFVVTDSVSNNRAVISKHSVVNGELLLFQQFKEDTLQNSMFNALNTGFNQLYNSDLIHLSITPYNDDSDSTNKLRLLTIDNHLNLISDEAVAPFNGDRLCNFNGTRIDNDGNILLYGSRSKLGQYFQADSANTLLVKMTPQGEQLWTRRYNDTYTINFLEPLADGDIIFNCGWVSNSYLNLKRIIKTNSAGEEQWRITFGGTYGSRLSTMIESSDGKILTANGWNVSSSNESGSDWWYRSKLQFQKITDLGTSYSIDQDVKYAPTRNVQDVFGVEELNDGNFIAWGYMQSTAGDTFDTINEIWTKPFTRAFLIKLDENLDSLWMRTYYHPSDYLLQCYSQYRFTDVAPMEDGGFVTCGWARIQELQNLEKVWLTRLDEYGCVEPGCQNVNVSEIVVGYENAMSVYPNPTSGNCTLEWNLDNHEIFEMNFSKTEVILIDPVGREIQRIPIHGFCNHKQIPLDLHGLPTGIYQAHWVSGATWLDSVKVVKE